MRSKKDTAAQIERLMAEAGAARRGRRSLQRAFAALLEQKFSGLRDELLGALHEAEVTRRRNLHGAMQHQSVRESAELVRQHMLKTPYFGEAETTLQYALSLAPSGGMALEFGVYSGKTLKVIADARKDGRVYGFDSFQGLPETWRSDFPAGAFASSTLPQVPGASLVVGLFDAVLPSFLEEHPGAVDFMHIDCDLYSSSKAVLDLVGPRLRPGSVVVFDEYFNYPGWQDHEFKAWAEYIGHSGRRFTYEAYTFSDEQVAVRIAG